MSDLADTPASDQVLDAWIDAWMQLVTELRATRGEIDATMMARSRQARQIAWRTRSVALGRT